MSVRLRWRVILAFATVTAAIPFWARAQTDYYVDARTCATCHAKIYETYQRTGMARSFYRPAAKNSVEDYRVNNRYHHEASGTYFTMIERDGKFYQRRYQIGFEGRETNVDEKQVDYVMGSGNHVRTYLHRTAAGALLELPLAWYAEKGGYWAMNPGYDKPDQPNARRKITYECMFCHNGYPRIPQGHEQLRAEPIFTGALPEGIDCQRCHGPGRRHVDVAETAGATRRRDPRCDRESRAPRSGSPDGNLHAVSSRDHQLSVPAFDSEVRSHAVLLPAGRAARGFSAGLRSRLRRPEGRSLPDRELGLSAAHVRVLLKKRRQDAMHNVP